MSFEKAAYTDAGVSMLSESVHGAALTITRAVAGTGTVDGDLKGETDVAGDGHTLSILSITSVQTDDGKPARRITLRTAGDDAAYVMHQVGVYGQLAGGEEELLFIMQDSHGVEVPAKVDSNFEIEVAVLLAVSNDAQINVKVDPEADAVIRAVLAKIADTTGTPGGFATLDENGKLNGNQLPELDVYTKIDVDKKIREAMGEHNDSEEAHANIVQKILEQVDSKISAATSIAASGNGYIRFADGTQICWGVVNFSTTFPAAFAKANYSLTLYCSSDNTGASVDSFNSTGFKVNSYPSNGTRNYIAIGRWK